MTVGPQTSIRRGSSLFLALVILAIAGGIFVLDLLTPPGFADSLLYLLPLVLTHWLSWRRAPFHFAALFTVLTGLGFVLSHPGVTDWVGTANRIGGIGLLWALAFSMAARKETEEGLQASRVRLDSIVESAMDAMMTVDDQQRVVLFNKAAQQMFQCPAAEALGQPIDRFIPARFRTAHREHIHEFGRSGATNRRMGALGTISGFRANGEEFPLEASISQVKTDGRRLYTVILRDISERQRMQEQLRRTERLAELGTLASGMAHEIGTPMNVILGRAEYLMERIHDEATKQGLKTIVTQVERITRVMNQLLAFARRRPAKRQALDLRQIVEGSLEIFQERLTRHSIRAEILCEDNLPAAYADADQMSQVLLNLIINAVHAMPDGGSLRIGLARANGSVKLTVADTGLGISKEDFSKIFDPFFTTKEAGKGTGLGLTVVKGIIEEHGGSIAVESEPGKGTTFTVHLPIHPLNQ